MKSIRAIVTVASSFICVYASAEDVGVADAIRRAFAASPELASMSADLRAAEATARQSGRRTNPELELSVENAGAEEATTETTLSVGQLFELGGDRRARVDAASASVEIARVEYESRRLVIESRVRAAFASLVAAQEQVAIARENVSSAEASFGAIRDRVSAGKVSPIEETRAGVTLSLERVELTRAEAELLTARGDLASTWGAAADGLVALEEPVAANADEDVEAHPEVRRAAAVIAQREAEARLERARAVPDLRASAGVRGYDDGDGPAAVAGVTIDLPLFDRNRDAIAGALARVEAARSDAAAVRVTIKRDLAEALTRRNAAEENVARYTGEIVPAAVSVHEAISEGYRLGKFGYLEVLDARRTLAQARQQLVAAQRELALARVDVGRLTGGWK